MKAKKHHLIIIVLVGLLSVTAFGATKPADSNNISARPDPALVEIDAMNVVIISRSAEPNERSFDLDQIQTAIKQKLQRVGIRVNFITAADLKKASDTPELRIRINILKPAGSDQAALHIETSLFRKARLAIRRGPIVMANTWTSKPARQLIETKNISSAISELTLAQVSDFVKVWLVTNPRIYKRTRRNVKEQHDDRPSYLASKSSKIFHKASCSVSGRISTKNLVYYDTNTQAIEAGKRPCKRCKP
ncbi:MAG: Ada metal-binding domain-containing protein [Planctomycetota bacterium]